MATQAETLAKRLMDDCPYRDERHPTGPHPSIHHADYPTWGSACLAWARALIAADGGVPYAGGGYELPDGSILVSSNITDPNPNPDWHPDAYQWITVWSATDQKTHPPIPFAPPNPYGITHVSGATDVTSKGPLSEQLERQGVSYESIPITHLVGMGGTASLIVYTSPNTGQSVTVFVIPHADIDSWAEDYYYLVGMTRAQAVARTEDEWIAIYDAMRARRRLEEQGYTPKEDK